MGLMDDKKSNKATQDETVLLKFLKRTKEGTYAPIDNSSLRYVRMKEQTDTTEEEYYYGLS